MRFVFVLALLFAAAPADAQTAPDTNVLHGHPNTREEFEIRPGITLGVDYGSDGIACHADITPLRRPLDWNSRRDTIPRDTINSVIDQVLPVKTYDKDRPSAVNCMSLCWEFTSFREADVEIDERRMANRHFEVEGVSIEFNRPPCGLSLYDLRNQDSSLINP